MPTQLQGVMLRHFTSVAQPNAAVRTLCRYQQAELQNGRYCTSFISPLPEMRPSMISPTSIMHKMIAAQRMSAGTKLQLS